VAVVDEERLRRVVEVVLRRPRAAHVAAGVAERPAEGDAEPGVAVADEDASRRERRGRRSHGDDDRARAATTTDAPDAQTLRRSDAQTTTTTRALRPRDDDDDAIPRVHRAGGVVGCGRQRADSPFWKGGLAFPRFDDPSRRRLSCSTVA
jgi:hypothetical protein